MCQDQYTNYCIEGLQLIFHIFLFMAFRCWKLFFDVMPLTIHTCVRPTQKLLVSPHSAERHCFFTGITGEAVTRRLLSFYVLQHSVEGCTLKFIAFFF